MAENRTCSHPLCKKKRNIHSHIYILSSFIYRCSWMKVIISEFFGRKKIINVRGYVNHPYYLYAKSTTKRYTHTCHFIVECISFYVPIIGLPHEHHHHKAQEDSIFLRVYCSGAPYILPSCCIIIWPMISFSNTTICCLRQRRCGFCIIVYISYIIIIILPSVQREIHK